MQLNQILKLLALFFGAFLVVGSVNSVLTLPRSFSDGLFANGLWIGPAFAFVIALMLYIYASMIKLPDDALLVGLVPGLIKLFGLYLGVNAITLIVSGVFALPVAKSEDLPLSEINNSHLYLRPFVIGGLKIGLAFLFVFHTSAVARFLKIRSEA